MAPKLFVTGATGYIGGDALFHIVEAHPEYEIACLVRNSEKGAEVASQYAKVRLVYGDLATDQILEEEAGKADVVLHCASSDEEGAPKALIRGLASHTDENPGYLIHTSGTGMLTFQDVERRTFGEASEKVFDDWVGIDEVTSLPDSAIHRNVDKIVLAAAADYPSRVRTAIVCPPCIYGKGRGPGNQRSIQMPDLANRILQRKEGFKVGEGLARWTNVHVHDLSDCYLKLVEAAVSGGGNATWDKKGYYFTENGDHAWGDMSSLITKDAAKKGLIPSTDVTSITAEDAGRLRDYGFLMWGANSRCKALRAKRLLNWQPQQKIDAEISKVVDTEARSLGLTQGHAVKAAG